MSELKEKGLGVFINLDKWGISTFTLKIIAMITMIIDHVGFLFFQDNHQTYIILRSIGRISFPIFCFVLVEGFFLYIRQIKTCNQAWNICLSIRDSL